MSKARLQPIETPISKAKTYIEKLKYKLPLMPLLNGDGFQGVVDYNKSGKIRCLMCNKCFKNLGIHLSRTHKLLPRDYKIRFGLKLGTSLMSLNFKGTFKECHHFTEEDRKRGLKAAHRARNRISMIYSANCMEKRNQLGCCPSQNKKISLSIYDNLGRLSSYELQKKNRLNYTHIIKAFGSWANYQKALKLPVLYTHWSDENILRNLREFTQTTHRKPTEKDIKTGLLEFAHSTLWRHFKTMENALKLAGCDEILQAYHDEVEHNKAMANRIPEPILSERHAVKFGD